MIDPTLTAAAIVTVVAALGGGVVQIINAVSAARDRRDARLERAALRAQTAVVLKTGEDTGKKADAIIEKASEIHGLANGTLGKVTTMLGVANEKIAGLEKLIAQAADSKRESDAQAAKLLERADAAPAVGAPTSAPFGRRASDKGPL